MEQSTHSNSRTPLFDAVRDIAVKWPEKLAVEGTSGQVCDYKSLIALAEKQASNLARKGVRSGDCIAVYCSNSVSYASLILAVCRLGACYVPILGNFDADQRQKAFQASDARFVIVDGTRDYSNFGFPTWQIAELEDQEATQLNASPESDGIFRKLWSSGSTGIPKLIGWTQRKLLTERLRWNEHIGVRASDRFFCKHPLDVAHATDLHMFSAWLAGATLILNDEQNAAEFDWTKINSSQTTILSALPEHYRQWLKQDNGQFPRHSSPIRLAMCGGTFLSPSTIQDVEEGLGFRLRPIYGSTEFGLAMISRETDTDLCLVKGVTAHLEPIDGEPTNTLGHLVLVSDCTSEGYLNNEEAHQDTFRPTGFWTGDLASQNTDGSYRIIGRAKEMVRLSDRWLTASMIEQLVQERIGPNNCAAIIGQNSSSTVAVTIFVEFGSSQPNTGILEQAATTVRDSFGLKPKMVAVSSLPHTEVGKPDKQALRRQLEEANAA